jgi:hypothetical protein
MCQLWLTKRLPAYLLPNLQIVRVNKVISVEARLTGKDFDEAIGNEETRT